MSNVSVEIYNKEKHYNKVVHMSLREADKRELKASTGCASIQGLGTALDTSDLICYVYFDAEGHVIAVSGASSSPVPGIAIVWAMATDEVFQHWNEVEPLFIKHVDAVLSYPRIKTIGNVIDLRNDAHVRWIKKLGFTLTGITMKLGGYNFESFYKRRDK